MLNAHVECFPTKFSSILFRAKRAFEFAKRVWSNPGGAKVDRVDKYAHILYTTYMGRAMTKFGKKKSQMSTFAPKSADHSRGHISGLGAHRKM